MALTETNDARAAEDRALAEMMRDLLTDAQTYVKGDSGFLTIDGHVGVPDGAQAAVVRILTERDIRSAR